jgi:DNA-binding LacI/PurR family transcriptional regulator
MISQRTIAAAFGLSRESVKNALNGSGRTSRKLSETVIDYARTHGYSGRIRPYRSKPKPRGTSNIPVQVAGGSVSHATFEWMTETLGWSDCGAFEKHGERKETA